MRWGLPSMASALTSREEAQEVAAQGISFSMVYGVSKEDSELIGAWWGGREPTAVSSSLRSFCWAGASSSWARCTHPGKLAGCVPRRP